MHRALQRATGCRIRTRPVADEDAIAFGIDALCAQRGPAISLQTRCAKYVSQLALEGRGLKAVLKASPMCTCARQVVGAGGADSNLRAAASNATCMAVAVKAGFPTMVAASCGSKGAVASSMSGMAVAPKRATSAGVAVALDASENGQERSGGLDLAPGPTLELAEKRRAHFGNATFSFWVPRLTGRAYARSQQRSRAKRRERRGNKKTACNHRPSTSPKAGFNEVWREMISKSRSPSYTSMWRPRSTIGAQGSSSQIGAHPRLAHKGPQR